MNVLFDRIIFSLTLLLSVATEGFSRQDSLRVNAELSGVAASNTLRPLWSYSNQWGRYSQFGKGETVLSVGAHYRFMGGDDFWFEAGIDAASLLFDDSFLQEGYVRAHWKMADFIGGMMRYSPIAINDRVTSGSFLMSANARPIPKLGIGFFDYRKVPYTFGYLAVRGGVFQGWPLNDDHPRSVRNVWLHEKFAYGRLDKFSLKPYMGLTHSAYFGGITSDGQKIIKDFWPTFFAKGSEKIGGGELTNAAGAHMGLWDFGVDYEGDGFDIRLYYQKPIADASGYKLGWGRNKDHTLGLYYHRHQKKLLTSLSIEWIKTDFQGGPGTADPWDPVRNEGVWPGDITTENYHHWMADRFPQVDTQNWSWSDVFKFLRKEWNHGHEFGGRGPYMVNGMYYQGWTHKGLSTGIPLFHSSKMIWTYAPGAVIVDDVVFNNTRLNAVHFGAEGWLGDRLSYLVKLTGSKNLGGYEGKFVNRFQWERVENYFFSTPKYEYYTYFRGDYLLRKMKNIAIFASVSYDFGDLYHSFGAEAGLRYSLNL